MSSSSKQLNPFYIDKVTAGHNGDDDDWADSFDDNNNNSEGWGDDDEDLEELLEQEGQQPRRSKGGYLPVRNLTAAQKQQLDTDTRWRRNSYCCLLLVAAVVAAYLHAKNRTSFNNKDSKNSQPIQRITILGERNSGLEWLEERLKECYPNNVTVTSTLFRKGYFFQDKPSKEQPKTIVVAVFLNPYDWVELMRLRPQFMPLHNNISSWKPFLSSQWTMDRPPSDRTFASSPNKARVCQHNFTYHQVVSCSPPNNSNNDATDFHHPIYELRRSVPGEPYSTILKLRSDKIRNFLQEVAGFDSVEKVVSVRYETLVEDTLNEKGEPTTIPGLWTALQAIANISASLAPVCDLKGPGKKHFFAPAMGNHDSMTPEFVEFMNTQLDWSAEKLVGYKQWDANKIPLSPTDYDGGSKDTHTNKDNDQTDDRSGTDDTTMTTPAPSTAQGNTPGTTKPVLEPTTQAPTTIPKTGSPSKFATRKPVVSKAPKRDGSTAPAAEPTTISPTTIPKTGSPTTFATTKKPTVPKTKPPEADASAAPAAFPTTTTTSTPGQIATTTTAPSTTTNRPTTEPKTGSPTTLATRKPTVPKTKLPKTGESSPPAADPTTTSTPGQTATTTIAPSTTTNSPTTEPKTVAPTSFETKQPPVPGTKLPNTGESSAPAADPTTTTVATTNAPSAAPITTSPTMLPKQGESEGADSPSVAPSKIASPSKGKVDPEPSPADQDDNTAPGP